MQAQTLYQTNLNNFAGSLANYKTCFDNNNVNLALLQIRSMPIGTGLLSPATLLLKRLIQALLPHIKRKPIKFNVDDKSCEVLKLQQDKYLRGNDTFKDSISFMNGCFSFCLTSFILDIFSKTEQYFFLLDKLLPDSVMASSRSEENVVLNNFQHKGVSVLEIV